MEIFSYFNSIRFICSHINSSSAVLHSWKHRMSRQQQKRSARSNTQQLRYRFSLCRAAHTTHALQSSSSRKIFSNRSFLVVSRIERFQLYFAYTRVARIEMILNFICFSLYIFFATISLFSRSWGRRRRQVIYLFYMWYVVGDDVDDKVDDDAVYFYFFTVTFLW